MRSRARFAAQAALSFVLACGGPPSPNERIENAQRAQKEETADNLYASGRAFAAVGDMTRAEEYLALAIDKGGDETKIIPILLDVCVRDNRLEVAVDYAKPYLGRHPRDTRTRYVLATLYAAVSDPAHAKEEVARVVEERPGDPDPHYLYGRLLRDSGDLVGADEQFRAYLKILPQGPHAEEARASLLLDLPKPATSADGDAGPTLIAPLPVVASALDASAPPAILDAGGDAKARAGVH